MEGVYTRWHTCGCPRKSTRGVVSAVINYGESRSGRKVGNTHINITGRVWFCGINVKCESAAAGTYLVVHTVCNGSCPGGARNDTGGRSRSTGLGKHHHFPLAGAYKSTAAV